MTERIRWSDDKLEKFYDDFLRHHTDEQKTQARHDELYDAVFQQEDTSRNVPPGLLQLTSRISQQLHDMRVWQDRQKTFVGGAMFALSALWFILTDVGAKIVSFFHGMK